MKGIDKVAIFYDFFKPFHEYLNLNLKIVALNNIIGRSFSCFYIMYCYYISFYIKNCKN